MARVVNDTVAHLASGHVLCVKDCRLYVHEGRAVILRYHSLSPIRILCRNQSAIMWSNDSVAHVSTIVRHMLCPTMERPFPPEHRNSCEGTAAIMRAQVAAVPRPLIARVLYTLEPTLRYTDPRAHFTAGCRLVPLLLTHFCGPHWVGAAAAVLVHAAEPGGQDTSSRITCVRLSDTHRIRTRVRRVWRRHAERRSIAPLHALPSMFRTRGTRQTAGTGCTLTLTHHAGHASRDTLSSQTTPLRRTRQHGCNIDDHALQRVGRARRAEDSTRWRCRHVCACCVADGRSEDGAAAAAHLRNQHDPRRRPRSARWPRARARARCTAITSIL